MSFQAINKGPSRLPGSRVDIRIPNRLTGNGAEMFHIIETQVDASSSPSTLFIQTKLLFISLFTCRKPHFNSFIQQKPCLFCSSWHSCLYPLQSILLCTESCYTSGFLFMGSLLSVGHHRTSESWSKNVDIATEDGRPFCFTTFGILTKKYNTPTRLKYFLNPCIKLFIQVDHGGAQTINCIDCEWADRVDCIPPTAIWNHFRGLRRLARNGSGTPEGAGYYTVPSLAWNHIS